MFMEKIPSSGILHVLGALLIIAVGFESTDGIDTHAYCEPRPTVVHVDKPQYRYYPFFATLNRCGGSCPTHPGNQRCNPIAEEEVKIQFHDIMRNKLVDVTMTNHTECKCMCVASFDSCNLELESWEPANCRCRCRYPDGPPKDLACKPGFIWRRDICRCQCNKAPEVCPPNKVWSTEACGCVCSKRIVKRCQRKEKGLDKEKCECVDIQALLRRDPKEESPNSRLLITLLVGQGFLLVVIICVLIYYIRKSKRKAPPTGHDEEDNSPRPTQSIPSDSGNISINSSQGIIYGSEIKEKERVYEMYWEDPKSEETSDHGLTSPKPHFHTSNGSVNLWNGLLVSKETVID